MAWTQLPTLMTSSDPSRVDGNLRRGWGDRAALNVAAATFQS
jgi:hypothetical protein